MLQISKNAWPVQTLAKRYICRNTGGVGRGLANHSQSALTNPRALADQFLLYGAYINVAKIPVRLDR